MLLMNKLSDRASVWLATGAGIGLVSPAPGTVGGLWGLPLAWLIGQLGGNAIQSFAIVIVGLGSVAICSRAAQVLGGKKDPGAIVLDEIAALPIVFLGVEQKNLVVWLMGFLLFRVFDISKPPPVRDVEQLPAGWGIMADDWVAAMYACLALNFFDWLMLPTAA